MPASVRPWQTLQYTRLRLLKISYYIGGIMLKGTKDNFTPLGINKGMEVSIDAE